MERNGAQAIGHKKSLLKRNKRILFYLTLVISLFSISCGYLDGGLSSLAPDAISISSYFKLQNGELVANVRIPASLFKGSLGKVEARFESEGLGRLFYSATSLPEPTITCDRTTNQWVDCAIKSSIPQDKKYTVEIFLDGRLLSAGKKLIVYPAPSVDQSNYYRVAFDEKSELNIRGSGFREGLKISIGDQKCHPMNIISAEEILCGIEPQELNRKSDIKVINLDEQQSVFLNAVHYLDMAPPQIQAIRFPSKKELLKGGDSFVLEWNALDNSDQPIEHSLDYSNDMGVTWMHSTTATGNHVSKNWIVPKVNSKKMKLRIRAKDSSDNEGIYVSEPEFEIDSRAPYLTLLSHGQSIVYRGGAESLVLWTASDENFGQNPITLKYSLDSITWHLIAELPNTGSYLWTMPAINSSKVYLQIFAKDILGQESSYMSPFFSIDSTPPSIELLTLKNGGSILNNSNQRIRWVASDANFGANPIDFFYSADSGVTWKELNSVSLRNTGYYDWNVDLLSGENYRLKIQAKDLAGNIGLDATEVDFKVTEGIPRLTQELIESPLYTGAETSSIQIGGECTLGIAIDIQKDGQAKESINCDQLDWTYTVTESGEYTFTQTNHLGVASVEVVWVKDEYAPVIHELSVNDGAEYLSVPFATLTIKLTDIGSGQSGIKVRYRAVEGSGISCGDFYQDDDWIEHLNEVSHYDVEIPDSEVGALLTKTICVWARDLAGNTSLPSKIEVDFVDVDPPKITEFKVHNTSGDIDYRPGQTVVISWTMSDSVGLHNYPVSLEYTTDAGKSWNLIESSYGGLAGNPTSYTHQYEGFLAPEGVFRIRIRAKNKYNILSTALVSETQSSTPWSVYAGSVDRGAGGGGRSASIYKSGGTRTNHFAVDPITDDLFWSDNVYSGVMRMSSKTGLVTRVLQLGPETNLPANGPLPLAPMIERSYPENSAASDSIVLISFDKKGRLYVLVGDTMRYTRSSEMYQIDFEKNWARRYLGRKDTLETDETQTSPQDFFMLTSDWAFDEDNNLYFFATCPAYVGTPYVAANVQLRILKLSQTESGAAGGFTPIAGNCTRGTPIAEQDAITQPLFSSGDPLFTGITVWDRGDHIYYTSEANGGTTRRIVKGKIKTSILTAGVAGLRYNSKDKRLYFIKKDFKAIHYLDPSKEGSGVILEEYIPASISNGSGCLNDRVSILEHCMIFYGSMAFNKLGSIIFGIGPVDSDIRIGYLNENQKIRIMAGNLPFSGDQQHRLLMKGRFSGIYYKSALEPHQEAFPEGLYFIDRAGIVFGRIGSDGIVNHVAGDQRGDRAVLSDGSDFGPNSGLGSSSNQSGRNFVFNSEGLPWIISQNRLISISEDHKVQARQLGDSQTPSWHAASVNASPSNTISGIRGGLQNLVMKGKATVLFFGLGHRWDQGGTNPLLRALNFELNKITQIMGTAGVAPSPDSQLEGDVSSKSIDGFCIESNCAIQFVENDPTSPGDDEIYIAENERLRVIKKPWTPSESTITTLLTLDTAIDNFILSVSPMDLKPDGKRVYYTKKGELYCYAFDVEFETEDCKNSVLEQVTLGPPVGMAKITKGPNQMTWRTSNHLLISTMEGEIYQYNAAQESP